MLDQLELHLADLEENAAQAETTAKKEAEKIGVPSFERRKPARRRLPEHLQAVDLRDLLRLSPSPGAAAFVRYPKKPATGWSSFNYP
ncbi:transposase [Bradyrhizobium sp. 180]|uniref:transposase n=1 Tax=Bradyrhizobium sp. 180 TaxID=2782650 RepID=UPI001FF94609|nr:transposase [Bradyrhizobium sp. 180]